MKITIYILLSCLFISILLWVSIISCEKKTVGPEPANTITISSQGGEYTFPDGILLRIPAGAVTEDMDVTLRKVNREQLIPIFNARGVSIENLLVCIEGKPDGTEFIYPVQLCISVDLEPGDIPFVHEIDLVNGDYTPAQTEIFCYPEKDSLLISLNHFSTVSAEVVKELEGVYNECATNPCRCGDNVIVQGDKDYACDNGECQISESKLTITFSECPGQPVEEHFVREVSAGCKPKLVLSAANTTVPTGGQTSLTAQVYLGCEPTEGQSVDFSISGPATLSPTYSETNADGEAHSTFIAGNEEGTATVTARSTVSYYTFIIYASAGGQQETAKSAVITEELSQRVDIEIEESTETWSGTMSYEYIDDFFTFIRQEATYNVNFTFSVSTQGDIFGTATALQEVSITAIEGWCIQNIDAPLNLNLQVSGDSQVPSFYLVMELPYPNPPFYTWEYYCCAPECTDPGINPGTGIRELAIGLFDDNPTLTEGIYMGEYSLLPGWVWITYTITLHRESSYNKNAFSIGK